MKTRVITGILLAAFFVPPFVVGSWYLMAILLLLSVVATYELFQMYNVQRPLPKVVLISELLMSAIMYWSVSGYFMFQYALEWAFMGVALVLVIGSLLMVFVDEFDGHAVGDMLMSVLYPSIAFGAIYGLRDYSVHNIGFLFMITISTDVFAYIVGIRYGKHRLAIKISPKKSIEGSIGGAVFAVLFTMLYLWGFGVENVGAITINWWSSILLILVISSLGQIGDLVASKMKRSVGIKDFSNIFPGHGGVMDRFDSVLFAGLIVMIISQVVTLL
ncbi:phosphatidate cytidylyltransferase [Candidatus Xianfuyuplasma coldseepsis]|uniref:Phosphatidate cytidylyltransferase n=1 Tax=Candidatus Xianfuyuplasma coldseepsis TaxID=2782163 RepID=A0A7L7KRK3_9MOLU|nr:phosphatidate cytidylyltransferase [Xianfuyuplasma coldseepsis]QMS85451.1 phosphatidate cytidylyltransferase [Xianfuyuplasma coldseepsis]